ncbi:DNA repair protein RecN [Ichthyenterobacterium sp. W332]|uniref:DNA repair protein RecN n=1 Tax=Microcosmobacter mediterraneus TaxID=3075607 RepID=A0ABU2YH92_9FLAO|nr:DNA repair protein RecN [Ichthyenterobacterium sp. W332]MDT0557540.1 DNA repair protein RecN [Ichthyenterobacterium sp. W332]
MLTNLSIKNYALIEDINVAFSKGLTIITGETGAGKSILLGGLSLILGKRADLSMVKEPEKKCIIEGVFNIEKYKLKSFFESENLDYESQTIIRREILPSGKSRAFVNDSPVKLEALQKLSTHLIDVHSQNETLELTTNHFQFQIIDAIANNNDLLEAYTKSLADYKSVLEKLENLKVLKADALKEYDYNSFLLQELLEVDFKPSDLEVLENEFKILDNVEQLKDKLDISNLILNDGEVGLLNSLRTLSLTLLDMSKVSDSYTSIYERINSCFIELDDINNELELLGSNIEADPKRLQDISNKLSEINTLFNKHNVNTINELIDIKNDLELKVNKTEHLDTDIDVLEKQSNTLKHSLFKLSKQIHHKRKSVIPDLKDKLKFQLKDLGMENAEFDISVVHTNELFSNGMDELSFLFSANKGGNFNALKKSASGGELSRIMLALKSILSKYSNLPTIMFDEIDTGVSGEISNQMARIMKQMSAFMQVFTITHLPQIAAKGDTHFKVYKTEVNEVTQTQLKELDRDERIVEIAQMLGGSKISESAVIHAKELLN